MPPHALQFLELSFGYDDAPFLNFTGPRPISSPVREVSTPTKPHPGGRSRQSALKYQIPSIPIEKDVSLDVSPLSSPILLSVSQDVPCSVGPHHQDSYSREHHCLDDKTLTSTPQSIRKDVRFILPADSPCDDIDATFVSKPPTLFSTPSSIMKKRGRRSISYSEFPNPRLATSRHHFATRTSPFQEHLNRPRRRATVIRTDLFKDPALPLTIVEPPRKQPRLRRRGRRSDLRGAFRNATDVCQSAVHVSATVDGPGLHEQTIEHQITLSLLHEMERATGGQTTLPQTNKQAKSRPFAKGILSTLGNFIRSLGSHTTTGVVRI